MPTDQVNKNNAKYAVWCFGVLTLPPSAAWELLTSVAPDAFYRLVRANKVTEMVTTNLRLDYERTAQNPRGAEILRLVEQEARARSQRTEIVQEESRAIHNFCQQQAIRVQFIKGLARASLYPSAYSRCIGDIDIFVEDCTTAEQLIRWLHTQGYSWDVEEFPWIKRWSPGGDERYYGQVSLYKPLSLAMPYVRADLHFGIYSIGQGGGVPFEISQHHREMELVILLGHAFGDGYFRVKDLNDWRILTANATINWQIVTEQLASLQLSHMLTAIQTLDTWQQRLSTGALEPFRATFPIGKVRRFKRATNVAYHTFNLCRQWESPLKALKVAGEALFYYLRNHQLHEMGGFPRSPAFDRTKLDRWRCWRLIPIGQTVQRESLHILGRNFWPTVWYDVPQEVLKEQAAKNS